MQPNRHICHQFFVNVDRKRDQQEHRHTHVDYIDINRIFARLWHICLIICFNHTYSFCFSCSIYNYYSSINYLIFLFQQIMLNLNITFPFTIIKIQKIDNNECISYRLEEKIRKTQAKLIYKIKLKKILASFCKLFFPKNISEDRKKQKIFI